MISASIDRIARFRRDVAGVTVVEFGLVGPVVVLMLMGIAELGLMMTGQAVLDNAAFAASRTGKTGYVDAGQTQAATVSARIKKAASSFLDPSKIRVTSVAYSDYDSMGPEPFTDSNKNGLRDASEPFTDVNQNGSWDKNDGTAGLGSSGQVVLYTATYDWTLFTPLLGRLLGQKGVVPLKARIAVKNEPY